MIPSPSDLSPDAWFHIIELCGGVPLMGKMLAVLMEIRDQSRDVGQKEPPTGLFKRMDKAEADTTEIQLTLTDMRARLGFKRQSDPP